MSSVTSSSSSSSSRRYDIVVFGATGFTGQYIAQYLVEYINKNSIKGINIGIAARDESRLTALRDRITTKFPIKLGMLIANTDDATSMRSMTSQTTVIINAVGPFRFYGDAVIEACIVTGTHYVDITGEPEFIERMILKHDDAARQAQVFVVPSCGFDSIPSDLGVVYTTQQWQQKFPGIPLPQITSYLTLRSGRQGAALNYGTWASLIQSVAHVKDLAHIRSQLKQKQETEAGRIPRIGPAPKLHSLSWESCVQRWTVKFMGADASVVRQSQQRMTLQDKKEGITHSYPYYSIYLTISSFFYVFIMGLLSSVGKCVASSEWGRQLMLKYPSWFTLGLLSTSGPTPQQVAEASFEMEMFASDGKNNLHTVVSGPEVGYAATSILVCQSALTVLDEIRSKSKRLARAETGGVMTPAAAFARTDLIDRLQREKIRFQIVE